MISHRVFLLLLMLLLLAAISISIRIGEGSVVSNPRHGLVASDAYDDDNIHIHNKKKKTKKNYAAAKASSLANSALKFTKSSVKSVIDFVAAKHVTVKQIVGKWKMLQEIKVRSKVITCPATIEFLKNGTVLTFFNGKEYLSEYTFTENSWPQSCKIQFTAYAFQGPKDVEPRKMVYKGYFKKSLLNAGVIMIRGKIYRQEGKLWKSNVKCGKFKATFRRYGK